MTAGTITVMQRRRVKKDVESPHQAKECSHGESKTVEKWQCVENTVSVLDVCDSEHLAEIGEDIPVREFHAFGTPSEPLGEENDGGIIGMMAGSAGW